MKKYVCFNSTCISEQYTAQWVIIVLDSWSYDQRRRERRKGRKNCRMHSSLIKHQLSSWTWSLPDCSEKFVSNFEIREIDSLYQNMVVSSMDKLKFVESPPVLWSTVLNCIYFQSCLPQFSSVAQLYLTLQPHGLQHARPPCPSPNIGIYSNSCPLSWWCHPTISLSVVPFSDFNLSQHQGLFKWVSSLHQVAKVLVFQLQHQSFQWTLRIDLL